MICCRDCRFWGDTPQWETPPDFRACTRLLDNDDVAWREHIAFAKERVASFCDYEANQPQHRGVVAASKAQAREDQPAMTAALHGVGSFLVTQPEFGCVLAEPR